MSSYDESKPPVTDRILLIAGFTLFLWGGLILGLALYGTAIRDSFWQACLVGTSLATFIELACAMGASFHNDCDPFSEGLRNFGKFFLFITALAVVGGILWWLMPAVWHGLARLFS